VAPAYFGHIREIEFDDTYAVISDRKVTDLPLPASVGPCCDTCKLCAWSVLGLACDPREPDGDWNLYFTLNKIYAQDGIVPWGKPGKVPYPGFVRFRLILVTRRLPNSSSQPSEFPDNSAAGASRSSRSSPT
jgi:hypothetical protein